jgi:phosphonate transport system permease protein
MIKTYKHYIWAKKKKMCISSLAILGIMILLSVSVGFNPYKILLGIPSMANLVKRMLTPSIPYIGEVMLKLYETVEIAIVSSIIGALLALPFAMLTARNITPSPILAKVLSAFFSLLRTVPSLIWAALLVSIFSIGKFSGIVALSITSLLISLKLLREQIEAISDNLINGTRAVGARKSQVLKQCVLPAIIEHQLSIFFLVFEINIRSATVLGLVGAGGIGQIMWRDLNHLRYDKLATLIAILFLTILIIDLISFFVRKTVKKMSLPYSSLKGFKRYQLLKNSLLVLVILFGLFSLVKSLSVDMDRLVLGFNQGLVMLRGMSQFEYSYLPKIIEGLVTSLFIALFATVFGGIGGFCLSYFTAINTSPQKKLSVTCKLVVNMLRTFPPIITAIIFFRGVGPGAQAGAIALSLYTTGVLTKLYSEVIENTKEEVKLSLLVTGASNFDAFRHGILPETIPSYIGLVLYRLESNIRNATILGIIGAGGIGTVLSMNITWRNWERVGLIILSVSLMIILIDTISSYLRNKWGNGNNSVSSN